MATLRWALISLLTASAFGQAVTTVETYGPAPAIQVYNGLGQNLGA